MGLDVFCRVRRTHPSQADALVTMDEDLARSVEGLIEVKGIEALFRSRHHSV